MSENITRIQIKYHCGYFCENPYEDILSISSEKISYKRNYRNSLYLDLDSDEVTEADWDFKIANKKYREYFKRLLMELDLYEQPIKETILDAPSFNILLKNGRKIIKDMHFDFCGPFLQDQNLQFIFFLIRKLIPQNDYLILPEYLNEQTTDDVDLDDLDTIIEKLESEDASAYPYPKWVYLMMNELLERDFEYSLTTDKLIEQKINISDFTFKEVKAYLTFVFRAEHFTEFAIKRFIESGEALQLMKRLYEICSPDDED